MNKVKDIRNKLIEKLKNEDFVIDKSGVKCIEILFSHFIADEDTIFGRKNEKYIEREIKWYKSQSLNVYDIDGEIPKIWIDVSSKSDDNGVKFGQINSNYGWMVWSNENHNQYDFCLEKLKADKYSRQGMMIYTRPSINKEYNINGMSDFVCTNTVQYFIRDNKLHALVSMRSNDAVFGYNNDFAWQQYVHRQLYSDLCKTYENLRIGDIIWNAASLHVYERHFGLVYV